MTNLIWATIISIIFLMIFIIAEIMHKKGFDIEVTRKFVHFAGAFTTLFFPFIFNSHWVVLALAVAFGLIMFITKKCNWLQSVHAVERKSEGAIYHPMAVYFCFLYSEFLHQPWFYIIAIMILAISDASAALVGKNYGSRSFIVEPGSKKSLEGSICFFLSAFLITHLILLLTTDIGRLESVLVAVLISVIVTIFEGVSLKGTDNLFVPIGTMFILSKNVTPHPETIATHIGMLFLVLITYLVVMRPYKRIGFSGILLLGLINYIIGALLGNLYALIIFAFSFLCQKTNIILTHDCEDSDAYRVTPVFYILTVPLICAFVGDYLNNFIMTHNLIFYPFIASMICQGVIIRERLFDGNLNKGLVITIVITSIVALITAGVSYVLYFR